MKYTKFINRKYKTMSLIEVLYKRFYNIAMTGEKRMKNNIKRISELTGFSPATISNALNNKRGVNKDTAERILKVAQEIGYVSRVKVNSIKFVIYKRDGLVVADTPFFAALIEGVDQACRDAGYDTVIYTINQGEQEHRLRIQDIIRDNSAGILLLATELTREDMKIFEQACSPLVVMDAWFENMAFDTVLANNEDSVKDAVNFLFDKGHREIGYLSGNVRTRNFIDRGAGYRKAMAEKKVPLNPDYRVRLTPTMDGAYKDMCQYLGAGPKLPSAYIADNDIIALGAMKALKQFGYKIPKDVSIIGFDDLPFSEISSPGLTTIKFFQKEMGRIAVQRLVEKIRTSGVINTKIQISTQFVERESVLDLRKNF